MEFYKTFVHNTLLDLAADISSLNQLDALDNSLVAHYHDDMTFCNVTITAQNSQGFVSVRHIKDLVWHAARLDIERQKSNKLTAYVDSKLKLYRVELADLISTIARIKTGDPMHKYHPRALALIYDNQKSGTGNWFIFTDYGLYGVGHNFTEYNVKQVAS